MKLAVPDLISNSYFPAVAAVEFGIFSVLLFASLANVTDVSIYIYQRMQVENATEVAAQAALKTCGSSNGLPVSRQL